MSDPVGDDGSSSSSAGRGAKHVSVFSTRMDGETAALVTRLVGDARAACGADVPKLLVAVKVRVTCFLYTVAPCG